MKFQIRLLFRNLLLFAAHLIVQFHSITEINDWNDRKVRRCFSLLPTDSIVSSFSCRNEKWNIIFSEHYALFLAVKSLIYVHVSCKNISWITAIYINIWKTIGYLIAKFCRRELCIIFQLSSYLRMLHPFYCSLFILHGHICCRLHKNMLYILFRTIHRLFHHFFF